MASFKLKDSNIYPMPGSQDQALHLGTIGHGLREYVVFTYVHGPAQGNTYIEEVVLNTVDWQRDVFANLKFIEEDSLAFDLARFAEEKGLTDPKKLAQVLMDRGKFGWMIQRPVSLN